MKFAGNFPKTNKRAGCNKTMQAGKFPKINRCAGCNKAMQVGNFQNSIVKKSSWWKISKN